MNSPSTGRSDFPFGIFSTLWNYAAGEHDAEKRAVPRNKSKNGAWRIIAAA